MVKFLLKELPPQFVASQAKLLSVNRVTHAVELLAKRAGAYSAERKLNFVGRAVLLNSLKWKLRESGYPDDFAAVALEATMVACTQSKR